MRTDQPHGPEAEPVVRGLRMGVRSAACGWTLRTSVRRAMDSAGAGADDSRGAFSPDTTPSLSGGFSSFEGFPLPTFSPATTGDFRVKGRAAKVRDVAIADVHGAPAIRTAALGDVEDQVRMWVVRRGAWTLGGGSGGEHTVSAGQFLLRHVGRPAHFAMAPHTTAKIVVLPAAMLRPLLGNRIVSGAADSAEVRLLVAHTNMIHATMADLGPAGVQAAHSAVIELAKAVARHLTSELNVSVRTLQRAYAAGGESVGLPGEDHLRRGLRQRGFVRRRPVSR
ncbi:hypothetical protein [Streptomyces sp. NPDC004270]